jgi:hypothetical protein
MRQDRERPLLEVAIGFLIRGNLPAMPEIGKDSRDRWAKAVKFSIPMR